MFLISGSKEIDGMKRKLTEKTVCSSIEEQEYYCKRLAEMIACKTVSAKDKFVPQEFLKLRKVIKHLFLWFPAQQKSVILGMIVICINCQEKTEKKILC